MAKKIPTEQGLRKKVLWPLGTTLVIFLTFFLTIFQIYLQRELSRHLDEHVTSTTNLYQDFLKERSTTMQSLIQQVQKNQTLKKAMAHQDRQKLLQEATPIFQKFLQEQNITHFYFHRPNGINLLRVHKPERFGDQIERITMNQARRSNRVSSGAELGPLGTFTLRVVVPWLNGNEIIGYIEFGEEVEPMLERIASQTGSQMAILIKKDYLDQVSWGEGQQMLGRTTSWDLLPEHVITATTEPQLIKNLTRFTSPAYLSGKTVVELSLQQQQYLGRYLHLTDAGNNEIGAMLVLKNANATLNDHIFSTVLVTVFCILLGCGLFISAYTILGRTELSLDTTQQNLLEEIEKSHRANTQLGLEIGEKRAAEKALKEAHAELEQRVIERTSQLDQHKRLMENLISNIPSHVAWKNMDRAYIGCNIGFAKLVGSDEMEIVGKVDAELEWNPAFRRLLSAIDDEVLTENRSVISQELIDKSSADQTCYLCNAVPLHNESGEIFGMVSILQNITEQKNKQQLLEKTLIEARQSGDRISGVMRSVDDALFVVDADDKVLLMNESAGALLRLNPEEIIGKNASSAIWLGSLREKVMEILQKREGGILFDFEINNPGLDLPLVMQVRSSVLNDPQGRYEGMIFLARDVTRDRSMDRLKSDFISVAAHELRTPLATILGFSELLLDDNVQTDADRLDYTRAIYEKADSLSRLLDDMLDISRIESGRGLELFIEEMQVQELFMPTIKQYQKRVVARQFAVDLDNPELPLQADPDKISQVMENLLSNAVKYSEDESQISIAGKMTVEGYHLTVSDNGIGMTPEQAGHAFDKFYRGDNADKAVKGTGLGLTIVKHIVDDHKGRIWLESRPGKGTNVHFLLPIA